MACILSRPFNLIAFNLIWLGSVIGRYELIWVVAPAVLLYAGLLIFTGTVNVYQVLLPALLGICVDASLTLFGVFQFSDERLLLPLWLFVLWIAFATTLSQSLAVIGKHKLVAGIAGAVAVPLNYFVGERLGAVSFGYSVPITIVLLSSIWALLLPLLFVVVNSRIRSE